MGTWVGQGPLTAAWGWQQQQREEVGEEGVEACGGFLRKSQSEIPGRVMCRVPMGVKTNINATLSVVIEREGKASPLFIMTRPGGASKIQWEISYVVNTCLGGKIRIVGGCVIRLFGQQGVSANSTQNSAPRNRMFG